MGMNLRSILNNVAEANWKEITDHLVHSNRQMLSTPLVKSKRECLVRKLQNNDFKKPFNPIICMLN